MAGKNDVGKMTQPEAAQRLSHELVASNQNLGRMLKKQVRSHRQIKKIFEGSDDGRRS